VPRIPSAKQRQSWWKYWHLTRGKTLLSENRILYTWYRTGTDLESDLFSSVKVVAFIFGSSGVDLKLSLCKHIQKTTENNESRGALSAVKLPSAE